MNRSMTGRDGKKDQCDFITEMDENTGKRMSCKKKKKMHRPDVNAVIDLKDFILYPEDNGKSLKYFT